MADKRGILGQKIGMTQIWDEQNRAVPVTANAFGFYAILYFVVARELGDGWIVRALRAKPAGSRRLA